MAKIAIDNGHGRYTAGKRTPPFPMTGQVIHEWQFNYSTAKKLEKILKEQGHEVLMVSDTQDDTGLNIRAHRANQWKADVFISIHYNALNGAWGTHGGIETFHHPSSINGGKLAKFVQDELIKVTGLGNRGVKSANFQVLRETKMVSVLAECGFMDNLSEARLMLDENYQMKCARAMATGINKYLGYTPIKKEEDTMVNQIQNQPSPWAKEAWDWAKKEGLLDGTRPKDTITREEIAVVLKRLADSNRFK